MWLVIFGIDELGALYYGMEVGRIKLIIENKKGLHHCKPFLIMLVQMERLELSRPKSPPPQGGASTNSATSAFY